MEQQEEQLLHAKSGAVIAARVFGAGEEMCRAILHHTTGKADMTTLEKIIYLADYIEPTRSFCDLTEVRRLAMEDLDRAVLMSCTMSVENLEKKGGMIHPNSIEARDYLRERLSGHNNS